MKRIRQQINRLRRRSQNLPLLQDYERQQEKFLNKYPKVVLGTGTYGLPFVHDHGEGATLQIGAFCSIAGNVQIFLGAYHRSDWISTYPFPAFFEEASHIQGFEVSRGNVTIGSDVWLCANCTILSGVTIGHGAVIGTGAIVTKDVEPYAIVAGNPARTVRYRFDEATRAALLEMAWWDWPLTEIRSVMELLCSDQVHQLIAYAKTRKT